MASNYLQHLPDPIHLPIDNLLLFAECAYVGVSLQLGIQEILITVYTQEYSLDWLHSDSCRQLCTVS